MSTTLQMSVRFSTLQRAVWRALTTDATASSDALINRIRNVGIMAHIDAGKTTTTERMLYLASATSRLGDVDRGDTVTDYMDQERARGITITSASVTFTWLAHKINLLDTPGHIDFTLEVERSLRVLDGVITLLDGTAGVEAQTLSVWNQAKRYCLPNLCFINKMDRPGASLDMCIESIKNKLKVAPLVTQLPVKVGRDFGTVIDLVSLDVLKWPAKSEASRDLSITPLSPQEDNQVYEQAINARGRLLEQLAEVDDEIMDRLLSDDSCNPGCLSADEIRLAVARAALSQTAVPVLCGSALKNRGIQPLLDGIIHYLPSPAMAPTGHVPEYAQDLCAFAFKIIHDRQRGPLVFLRLYGGRIKSNMTVYNVNRGTREKVTRLLTAFADEFKEVSEISAGNIAVAVGLKQTVTGDTLMASATAVSSAKKHSVQTLNKSATESSSSVSVSKNPTLLPVLAGLQVPEPMFFCTIEPASAAYQKALDGALACLTREDPSLRVSVDSELGQTVLSGMGELHLDIIAERIRTQFKVDASLGPLQIAYRESVKGSASYTAESRSRNGLSVTLQVIPVSGTGLVEGVVTAMDAKSLQAAQQLTLQYADEVLRAVDGAVVSACLRGPLLSYPVMDVNIRLTEVKVPRSTPIPAVLNAAGAHLMEPVMNLEVIVPEEQLGTVLSDLSGQRRATIKEVQSRQDTRVIVASAPLATLQDYATALRTITSGTASFTMQFEGYAPVPQDLHDLTVQSV